MPAKGKEPAAWALLLMLLLSSSLQSLREAESLACNWGTRSSHPLPPDIVVNLLRDNGFDKVKLFEADPLALRALGRSNIQVMLGIPNEFLPPLAASVAAAEQWVLHNVSTYISKYAVDIRYVAVGNEPFLKTYKSKYEESTFPALQNIQAALIKAGMGRQVKVTVPLNADVYESSNGLPSGGDFRADIHELMLSIVRFLRDSSSPLTINIYPFLSLYADPNFPIDYAFFTGGAPHPLVDGPITYTNVFDANYDTLAWALDRNGFSDMPVIVGEIGWPTDGDPNANPDNARRFNQGLLDRIAQRVGTPKRPSPPDFYIFALLDEDAKSIQPGNFERHWGLFYYDASLKYKLLLPSGMPLLPAKAVRYLEAQWCVMSPSASLTDPRLGESVAYACEYADCTCLQRGSSCDELDARGNISYAFNQFYQTTNQQKGACGFGNLSVITRSDPSIGRCRFDIMIDIGRHDESVNSTALAAHRVHALIVGFMAMVVTTVILSSS